MAKRRRLIGYWQNEIYPGYPNPAELVDESWDEDERQAVVAYTRAGTIAVAFMGLASCRLCERPNGALELTDGTYQWPDGLAHYVEQHGVRLPSEFVEHVLSRLHELETQKVDTDWWLTETR